MACCGNSRIGTITRYGKEGCEIHGQSEGPVWTVEFEILGCRLLGLNPVRSGRIMNALMDRIKLDIRALERAYQGR